jgi:two-component system phosphate regulon sensor histidine kinase PhoR
LRYSISSYLPIIISLALSALATLIALGFWTAGLLAPLQLLFVLKSASGAPVASVESWITILMMFVASFSTSFAIERVGLSRAFVFILIVLLLLLSGSILFSHFLMADFAFAPIGLSVLGTTLIVQIRRLWNVDIELAQSIRRTASQSHSLEGAAANSRLVSGLRLLETVLPLAEAVIFHPDEDGNLAPAARLRQNSDLISDQQRNVAWREGVELCEQAIELNEIQTSPARGGGSSVGVPLTHSGRSVGALLVRLREPFDESDGPLLTAVGGQIARSFQRNETRKRGFVKDFLNFVSVRAARARVEAFRVVSGLLTEQRFGSQVIAETSDGQAIAYLDGTIASINQQMLRFARLTLDQAQQTDIFGLLDRFRSGFFDEPTLAVRRVLQTSLPYERELPMPERNQTLSIRIALAKESTAEDETSTPQPLCLAVTVRDVTGLKEYEKLRSDMVSLMSHELRTPITSINGFAELLALEDSIPESAREFVTIISNESQRLSRMIDTFLSVTNLQQKDKQEVLKAPIKLNEVVKEVVTNMQPLARTKRIRLMEQSSERIPIVAADRGLISRVVSNLIDNAIKYSPERTTITVSTILELDSVQVDVEDRGYGIPQEALEKVWEKFYRVARDGFDKEEKSTGLGLTFVKEVIEQHGGTVGVRSEIGTGSVFSFTLPRL